MDGDTRYPANPRFVGLESSGNEGMKIELRWGESGFALDLEPSQSIQGALRAGAQGVMESVQDLKFYADVGIENICLSEWCT